jgi:hypothetical protein
LDTKKEAENERNPNSEPEIVQKLSLKKSQGSPLARARKDTIRSFTFFHFPSSQTEIYFLHFNQNQENKKVKQECKEVPEKAPRESIRIRDRSVSVKLCSSSKF